MTQPAVVLLSGGIDSAVTFALAREAGFQPHALSVDYGQRHRVELDAARELAVGLGAASHTVVRAELRAIGGSALTADVGVPRDRSEADMTRGIPATYVPARNTILLSLALGLAEVKGAFDLFMGANALDYAGYPDCRPEYLEQFERLANLATKAAVEGRGTFRVHAPLLRKTKSDIIREAGRLAVDLGLTLSCYDPGEGRRACGRCDACVLRRNGFHHAGVPDPTRY